MSRLDDFIEESFAIEGVMEYNALTQLRAAELFLGRSDVTIPDMERLVDTIQPGNTLRRNVDQDVFIGIYAPPRGGQRVVDSLAFLLRQAADPYSNPWLVHVQYEMLHPFTDGNGRSGRMLWLWMMKNHRAYDLSRLFLHEFYYQTLAAQ